MWRMPMMTKFAAVERATWDCFLVKMVKHVGTGSGVIIFGWPCASENKNLHWKPLGEKKTYQTILVFRKKMFQQPSLWSCQLALQPHSILMLFFSWICHRMSYIQAFHSMFLTMATLGQNVSTIYSCFMLLPSNSTWVPRFFSWILSSKSCFNRFTDVSCFGRFLHLNVQKNATHKHGGILVEPPKDAQQWTPILKWMVNYW